MTTTGYNATEDGKVFGTAAGGSNGFTTNGIALDFLTDAVYDWTPTNAPGDTGACVCVWGGGGGCKCCECVQVRV